jgi:hypothetical protein
MTTRLPSPLKLPLLLSLLLLVPRVGLAAQDAPLATAEEATPENTTSTSSAIPGSDEKAPLRLMDEPGPEPRRWSAPLGLRILAEVAAGAVTSVGGGIAGGLVGLGLCVNRYGNDELGCALALVFGGGLGMAAAYPIGVWWGGEVIGGDGKLLMSMVGLGAGALAGLLLAIPAARIDPSGNLGGIVGGLAVLSGPILFYELSNQNKDPSRSHALAFARPRIQPLLSVSSDGALLGLGGSF